MQDWEASEKDCGHRYRPQWRDGGTSFFKFNVWRGQAEHLAESLGKGDRVMVTELEADEVGASLKWATAKVEALESARQRRPQLRPPTAGRTRGRLQRRAAL
jgi:hypothetical protein